MEWSRAGARYSRGVLRLLTQVSFAASLCAALVGQDRSGAVAPGRPPNVVFILADDLGYGDLGCYRGAGDAEAPRVATPRLDQMAAEGLRFTQFYAGSTVCAPSRCVLMTGKHTGHAHIRGNSRQNLRPEDVTVAELLQQRGYATGLSGKWGLGQEGSAGMPTRQGFDHFFGYLNQRHAHNYYPTFLIRGEERVALPNVVPDADKSGAGKASEKVAYSHDLVVDDALDFIRAERDGPFFLYLALTIPHANNEARKEGMEVPDLGPYADADWPAPQKGFAGMVHRMDRDVGRVLDLIDALGLGEDTVVMFTSDNGPHREGGNDPNFFDSNGPLRGIKRSLHDGGIRVPMLARWTGTVAPGSVTDHIGGFQDLLATCVDLAGGAAAGIEHDGLSFAPTLRGDDAAQVRHEYLYWEFYEQGSKQAVRRGRWKAIRRPMVHGATRLYDLADDLGEERDVAAQHPAVVKELEAIMEVAHVPTARWKAPAPREPGPGQRKRE